MSETAARASVNANVTTNNNKENTGSRVNATMQVMIDYTKEQEDALANKIEHPGYVGDDEILLAAAAPNISRSGKILSNSLNDTHGQVPSSKAVRDFVLANISSFIINSITAYVAPNGNNATGELGNPSKPFGDHNSALNAIPDGGFIYIYAGTYNQSTYTFFAKSVNVYCEAGVKIIVNGVITGVSNSNYYFRWFGYADFVGGTNTSTSYPFNIASGNNTFHFNTIDFSGKTAIPYTSRFYTYIGSDGFGDYTGNNNIKGVDVKAENIGIQCEAGANYDIKIQRMYSVSGSCLYVTSGQAYSTEIEVLEAKTLSNVAGNSPILVQNSGNVHVRCNLLFTGGNTNPTIIQGSSATNQKCHWEVGQLNTSMYLTYGRATIDIYGVSSIIGMNNNQTSNVELTLNCKGGVMPQIIRNYNSTAYISSLKITGMIREIGDSQGVVQQQTSTGKTITVDHTSLSVLGLNPGYGQQLYYVDGGTYKRVNSDITVDEDIAMDGISGTTISGTVIWENCSYRFKSSAVWAPGYGPINHQGGKTVLKNSSFVFDAPNATNLWLGTVYDNGFEMRDCEVRSNTIITELLHQLGGVTSRHIRTKRSYGNLRLWDTSAAFIEDSTTQVYAIDTELSTMY